MGEITQGPTLFMQIMNSPITAAVLIGLLTFVLILRNETKSKQS